jgi:hypothetical protein
MKKSLIKIIIALVLFTVIIAVSQNKIATNFLDKGLDNV